MKTILNIKKNPDVLLLFMAIALLFVFVSPPFSTLDEDMTMFSLPLAIMVWIFPVLLISFWLLYRLTRRFLYSFVITRIHIFVTISATMLIVAILYLTTNRSQFVTERYELIGNTMQVLVMLLVCGQLAYLANVFLGLLEKPRVQ